MTFLSTPNFESPTDAGGNNVYDIVVHADDDHGHDISEAVAITINDVNEQPSAGMDRTVSAGENVNDTTTIATVLARIPIWAVATTRPDNLENITYSIVGGNGSGLFEIDSSGQISLVAGQHLDSRPPSNAC